MLQGNQLKQLTDVVHELRKMQRLRVLSTPNIGAIIEYPSTFETTFNGRNTNQLDACSKISLNIMLKVYIVCTCCWLSNLILILTITDTVYANEIVKVDGYSIIIIIAPNVVYISLFMTRYSDSLLCGLERYL